MKLDLYVGQQVALATRHGKGAAITSPFAQVLGAQVIEQADVDTDALGTFTGEVARPGSAPDVCVLKARLGMQVSGLPIGLASEGSFGPHPIIGFIPVGVETMTLIDDRTGITVTEQMIAERTNYDSGRRCHSARDLGRWLISVHFGSHGLIVRPGAGPGPITKGITAHAELDAAIIASAACSGDGQAIVATDMRAHMNPTRMASIAVLAERLARRLATTCPACASPGWGVTGRVAGLPCEWCGTPTQVTQFEVLSCPRCEHNQQRPPPGSPTAATAGQCPRCNP